LTSERFSGFASPFERFLSLFAALERFRWLGERLCGTTSWRAVLGRPSRLPAALEKGSPSLEPFFLSWALVLGYLQ